MSPGDRLRSRRAGTNAGQGQSTVELAFLLPVVVMLMLAVIQVGLIGRDRLMVEHAAREAARAASVQVDPGSDDATRSSREAVLAAWPGADPGRLEVDLAGGRSRGERVTATVRYRPVGGVPVIGGLLNSIELSAEVTMRVE